jgi:hypothetical protein
MDADLDTLCTVVYWGLPPFGGESRPLLAALRLQDAAAWRT